MSPPLRLLMMSISKFENRFPFHRLVRFYDFDRINQTVADAQSDAVLKPVLRIA